MASDLRASRVSRRDILKRVSSVSVVLTPFVRSITVSGAAPGRDEPLNCLAGVDRIAIAPGRTFLRGWTGYGEAPRLNAPPRGPAAPPKPLAEPAPGAAWSKVSGPGPVTFADPKALTTTATFTRTGSYVLRLTAYDGKTRASSTVNVTVEPPPPPERLEAIHTKPYKINSPLWSARTKALIVNWIPHCIDQINRTDLKQGSGGIDNFVEAGKALRGETHGPHKGYVFSNAWVHQTVESMSIALMLDAQGDAGILKAQEKMRATLEDWIPKILSAQEPDGYLQTAFTLGARVDNRGNVTKGPFARWERRDDHEGYVAGYFLEAAINHHLMTGGKDVRLYNAARKLADCWCDNIGPAPKKAWYEGHQEMEQALVRFGRFVNEVEGGGRGRKYIELAKFLLDCRYTAARSERERREYDQSHLPVIEQYEAVGHAVRAVYSYSGMADVAAETGDRDYQSAVRSLWDNIVNRKYYVTGGIGSGETSEGFGPNYSLPNRAYCESCSSCGLIFFQWKLNQAYRDARYADLCEETLYNALLGSIDLEGKNFYYTNPLEENARRTPWHNCPCCVGNIPRTLLMLPTWMYAKSSDGVWVNLFAGSSVTIENVAGVDVEMVQATDYPWSGKVSITVNPKSSKRFSVRIRVPSFGVSSLYAGAPRAGGLESLAVNGAPSRPRIERGYAVINRVWKAGDRIDLTVPLQAQRVRASEKIEADRGRVALRYGPLVYCVEKVDQDINKILPPTSALQAEWRGDLLGGVTVIKSAFADGGPLLAIPYYARMNREPAPAQGLPAIQTGADGAVRQPPGEPRSIVWIRER